MSWIHTYTGREVSVWNPRPETIALEDIAHALSMQCRYNGHARRFYSIAEHSLLVARVLRERGYSESVQRVGLMHDAAEAYVGDMVAPIKMQPNLDGFRDIEHGFARAIQIAFELEDIGPEVKRVDLELLATEAPQVLPWPPPRDWELPEWAQPIPGLELEFLEPAEAERLFLDACVGLQLCGPIFRVNGDMLCVCGHAFAVHGSSGGGCGARDDVHGDRCCNCVTFKLPAGSR